MAKKKREYVKYTTYPFNEQDPIVGVLFTARRESKKPDSEVTAESKVAPQTRNNWWSGKTKRPQFATVAAVGVAYGLSSLPLTPEGRRKLKEG